MGVRGLAKFVYSHESSLLEPYKFCKTTVIIDGNNFIFRFFEIQARSEEYLFGGDYDSFYSSVTNFFGLMLKCGINPILLFDGCPPESKFETIIARRRERLERLIKIRKGFRSEPLSPTFMSLAFLEGLDEMGIRHHQMYEEADREIAALANHLNCPVMSNDSDFFIYDVDMIPLEKMDFTCRQDEDGNWYFQSQLYRSGSMTRLFPGLQRSILPMVGIIFGDDFVGKAFIHVFAESGTRNFRDIFERLQTYNNRESVLTEILQSLDGKEVERVERAIREILEHYDITSPVSFNMVDIETQATRDAALSVYGLDLSGLPDRFLKLYDTGKLSMSMLGLLRYKKYNLWIPVEDINQDSCHFSSIPIIREIYKILRTFMKSPEDITLNIRIRNNLRDRRETCPNQDYTRTVRLRGNVLKENEDFRRKVFFQSLGLDEIDGERLREFGDDWILFITSVVYWLRNTRELRRSYLSALLLTALCIYVKGMDEHAGKDQRVRENPARSFTYLVKGIPNSEYTKFHDRFNKVRKSDRDILARNDFFSMTHDFACLQSILFHVVQLNYLLGELFRGFRASRFYSGTFLFNLCILSEEKEFAKTVMEDLPVMRGAYEALENSVVSYWRPPAKKSKKPSK